MKRILFDVPLWHAFLHRDARGLPSATTEDPVMMAFQDELFDALYAGDQVALDGLKESSVTAWARNVHATCANHPDFQRLLREVRGDAYAAGLGVEKLMEQVTPPAPEANQPSGPALRRAVSQGAANASQAIEQHRDAVEGLTGIGGPSSAARPGSTDGGAARDLAKRLQTDGRLRQIAMLAGRFKRITTGRLRRRARHGVDEVCDVELGSELARLLPAELVRLNHPLLRGVLIRNLVENTALQYQLRGEDNLGKGPLIVCLDKSESMHGQPDIWATATALAMLEIAQREKRTFGLVAFNDGVPYSAVVRPGEKLPWDALFVPCHGGTDIHNALGHALEQVAANQNKTLRRSDIVLITDGESDTSLANTIREKAKELDVSILGVGIGVDDRCLRPWCDLVHAVVNMEQLPDATTGVLVDG
jgi:uncharacterized protein with von Willebrand factor type A (vWA) domain